MPIKDELVLKRFAENLSRIRISQELSIRQLATRCGTSHSNIILIERGEKNVTLLTMIRLAEGLQVPLTKLVDFKY